jgi:hypothetical protein
MNAISLNLSIFKVLAFWTKIPLERKEKEKIIYTDQQKKRYKGLIAQYFFT